MSLITEQFLCAENQIFTLKYSPDLSTLYITLNNIGLIQGIDYEIIGINQIKYTGPSSGTIIFKYDPKIEMAVITPPAREEFGEPPIPAGDNISVTPSISVKNKSQDVVNILRDIGIGQSNINQVKRLFESPVPSSYIIEPRRPSVPPYRCEYELGISVPANERELNAPTIIRPIIGYNPITLFNFLTGTSQTPAFTSQFIPPTISIPLSSEQPLLTAAQFIIEREIQIQIGTITAPLSNIAFETTTGIVTEFPPGEAAVVGASGTFGLVPQARTRTATTDAPRPLESIPAVLPPGAMYEPDKCIYQYGTLPTDTLNGSRDFIIYAQPGDIPYSLCDISDEVTDLYNTDWLAAISVQGGIDRTTFTDDDFDPIRGVKVYARFQYAHVAPRFITTFNNVLQTCDCKVAYSIIDNSNPQATPSKNYYLYKFTCWTGEWRQIPLPPLNSKIAVNPDWVLDESKIKTIFPCLPSTTTVGFRNSQDPDIREMGECFFSSPGEQDDYCRKYSDDEIQAFKSEASRARLARTSK